MKKITSLVLSIILLAVVLSGCDLGVAVGKNKISESEIETRFYEVYDFWLDWVYGSKYRQYDGLYSLNGAFKESVGGENCPINSAEELTGTIKSYFAKDLSDKFIESLCPEDIDGKLYIYTADVGDSGETIEKVTAKKVDDTKFAVEIDIYHVYEETNYKRVVFCVLEDGNWVFDNGESHEFFYCNELPDILKSEEAPYSKVLGEYIDTLYYGVENENLTPAIIYPSDNLMERFGFCFFDINKDGVKELLIGEISDSSWGKVVYDIYTLKDGEPYRMALGWERNRYYIYETDEGYMVANEGSSGAANSINYYYIMEEGELKLVSGVIMDGIISPDNPWFETHDEDYDVSNDTPISEEMYYEIIDAHKEMYITPEYTPFSAIG